MKYYRFKYSLLGRFTPGLSSYNLQLQDNVTSEIIFILPRTQISSDLTLSDFSHAPPYIILIPTYLQVLQFFCGLIPFGAGRTLSCSGYAELCYWLSGCRQKRVMEVRLSENKGYLSMNLFQVSHIWSPGKGNLFSSVKRK